MQLSTTPTHIGLKNTTAVLVVSLSLILLLSARQLRGLVFLNLGNIYSLRAALIARSYVPRAEARLKQAAANGQPQANWTLGYLAKWQQDDDARRTAQAALILGVPRRLYMLSNLEPDDEALAQLAVGRHPERPQALAWRAYQLRQSDPQQAVQLYERALDLNSDPFNWWFGLSEAYENLEEYEAALAAYEVACRKTIGILPCYRYQFFREKIQSR